ncbi:MAG: NYN domain-containing protein [Gaiellaceae bacterium]
MNIAVYIDWQNVYNAARRAFGLTDAPTEEGQVSPYRVAQVLAVGNGRGADGKLVRVEIHRGLPSASKDPIGYGANRKQSAAWMRESEEVVIPRLRPLRYPHGYPDEPPEEKGVDVQLALAAVEHTTSDPPLCDVAVIFSHDSDLVPLVQTICRLASAAQVETASWVSETYSARLRIPGARVFHHELTRDVYESVRDPVNYAHRS